MIDQSRVELWEWAEYYCPWCYITAVRLHQVQKEYEGRVVASVRFLPLELLNGEGPRRDILEQEWWLAALQESRAAFAPYPANDWPSSTLRAFDAVWAARQQGHRIAADFDLRVRRAFFADGRNIGRDDVLLDLAHEVDLDFVRLEKDFASPLARAAVSEEGAAGHERYHVRATPTLMLSDGTQLRVPIAFPRFRNRKIVAVSPMTCFRDGCLDATRAIFERALGAMNGSSSPQTTDTGRPR